MDEKQMISSICETKSDEDFYDKLICTLTKLRNGMYITPAQLSDAYNNSIYIDKDLFNDKKKLDADISTNFNHWNNISKKINNIPFNLSINYKYINGKYIVSNTYDSKIEPVYELTKINDIPIDDFAKNSLRKIYDPVNKKYYLINASENYSAEDSNSPDYTIIKKNKIALIDFKKFNYFRKNSCYIKSPDAMFNDDFKKIKDYDSLILDLRNNPDIQDLNIAISYITDKNISYYEKFKMKNSIYNKDIIKPIFQRITNM